MKKILLPASAFVAMALNALPVAAQYYVVPNTNPRHNPGSLNNDSEGRYDLGQPGWNLLVTGDLTTQVQPAWSAVQTLPFTFRLNGLAFNSYKVSTSGVLTFTTTATAVPPTTNTALPATALPDNSVGIWGVMMTNTTDYLITKTFGTAPNRQHWVQFNSVSIPNAAGSAPIAGAYVYCSIVLEESTNRTYLVWQRAGADAQTLTAGMQLDATTAYAYTTAPTTSFPNLTDVTPVDNQYYEIVPGTQPALDLSAVGLTLPNTAPLLGSVTVSGSYLNLGTQTVTSATANYRVGNGPVVSAPLAGLNVAPLTQATFTHPTTFSPSNGGVLVIKAWLSNPNGSPDQQMANDTTKGTVVVGDSTMRRLVVQEDFTSSTCPPCRAGNINVENVNRANPNKTVTIKYQQNFPAPGNDPYYTAESGARFNYYGLSAIPYMMLDGGWNGNSQSFTTALLNQYQAVPALARISGGYTLTGGNLVTVNAHVKPLFATPAGRLVAHVAVTERRTTRNARTNGETVFYQVMKKMLPNQDGTVLPALASGQVYNLNQTFDITTLPAAQAVERFDSLLVVVFVQDLVTKQEYQGAYLTLPRSLATHAAQAGPAFELAPNPSNGQTNLYLTLARPETVRVEVLDVTGRSVNAQQQLALGIGAQEIPLVLGRQAAGIYTIRVTTSAGVQTRKLALQ